MSLGHGASVVRDGLVLHLDAANVKSYPGTGTTWSDLSGNVNNGTLVNGVGYGADNKGSMVFDGVNDYVVISNITTSKSCSICLWFKDNTPNAWSDVFTFQTGADQTASRLEKHGVVANQYNWYNQGFVSGTVLFNHTGTQYDYIAMTFNSTTATCYQNGIQTAQTASSDFGTATLIHFGKRLSGGYWKGNISNIKIYNRALTATEVKQNFEALRGRYGI
jgi:hypothetical protein